MLEEIYAKGCAAWTVLKEELLRYTALKKTFFVLAAVYGVGISALIRANYSYVDDLARAYEGYSGWNNFSRYLSNVFSTFIHADTYLADISPLTQLLAVVIMALSGSLLLYVISGDMSFSVWKIAAMVPLGLSPYFLECFSYKFDSPYMAISVLASVVPVLFCRYGGLLYTGAAFAGILVVCMTYQAASGIFPMIVIVLCLKMWSGGGSVKQIGKFMGQSVVGYGVGLVFFKVALMKPADTYVSNALPAIDELIPTTIRHLMDYYALVKSDFKPFWLALTVLLACSFVYIMVRDSKRPKPLALFMAAVALLLMLLLAFGMYPLLSKPSYATRAMYGFGALLALLGIPVAAAKKGYPEKLITVALGWAFFTFAFTYGNALHAQDVYTSFRTTQIVNGLNELECFTTGEPVVVQLSGTGGFAPVLQQTMQNCPVLERMVPNNLRGGGWLYEFYHYYDMKNVVRDDSIDLTTYDLPVIADRMYYTIRGEGNYVLVELK